jgi:hypothetical protein
MKALIACAAAIAISICLAGSLFMAERLFIVVKPKLGALPWFDFAGNGL